MALLTLPRISFASRYPEHAITIIVPFAPGGSTDIVAKAISAALEKELGQSVRVINRSGHGGVTGTLQLLKAPNDGYTLGMGTVSTTATNPAINKSIGYDAQRDLTPIINIASTPNVLAVHPLFRAKTFDEFLEEVRQHPGRYSYASTGSGGIVHLQMEILKSAAQLDLVHIAFRGAAPALTDVLNGQIMIVLDNLPSALPHVMAGRLRPLAVAAPNRLPDLPFIPTFKELGFPEVNRNAFYGLVGPKDLPREIVGRINSAMQNAIESPEVRKKLLDIGATPLGGSPEDFERQIREEFLAYKEIVEKLNLK